MHLVAAATIWSMFSCFLIFPMLDVPEHLQRSAAGLLASEIVAVLVWRFGSEECVRRPCGALAEAGYEAASVDVPLLAVAVVALAIIHGVKHRPRASR
jgi:hypothetical protein